MLAAYSDIIYRETFGVPRTATADLYATNFDWQRFDNNGAAFTTGGSSAWVNYFTDGRPVDVANTNAGPNSDGTFGAYTNGILYLADAPSPSLAMTTEFSFNPSNYVAGSNVVLTWQSVPGWTNRTQGKTNLSDAAWTDVAGDVIATGVASSKTNAATTDMRFYRVKLVP